MRAALGSLLGALGNSANHSASLSILGQGKLTEMMRAAVAIDGVAVITSVPLPILKPGEVLVKVAYSAINRADTLQRKGLYPPPPGESNVLGLEVTGEVVETGPDIPLRSMPAIGSRVMVRALDYLSTS